MKIQGRVKKNFLLLILLFYTNQLFADGSFSYLRYPNDLYLAISGGYGELLNATVNTGETGLVRLGFGSMWLVNEKSMVGVELGFQTGAQMQLSSKSTKILGDNALPIYLTMESPIDFLLTFKGNLYGPTFLQAKGGCVFQNTVVTGGDVMSNRAWLPEFQLGLGMKISEHSRIAMDYQRFFGHIPRLANLNQLSGTTSLKGVPSWQAILLTVEINV